MKSFIFYVCSLILRVLGCILSTKWLVIWFWIELQRLALVPVLRSNLNPRSTEATRKYFLFQAMGRVLLLLGIFVRHLKVKSIDITGRYSWVEILIIFLAVSLKMGIFPGHFWFIDVMQGVKFLTGFFIAVVSKIVPIILIISLSTRSTRSKFILIGLASVVIGSVFGVNQIQLRKLIALSSVAHLGWMVIIFSRIKRTRIGALIFAGYALMVLPLFWLGKLFSIEHLTKSTRFSGNNSFNLSLVLRILSIAGFPPLLGFFYKWLMFFIVASVNKYLIIRLLILLSLISLYFYMQICLKFYLTLWPSMKIVLGEGELSTQKIRSVPLIVAITKVFLFYLLWLVPPAITYWGL